MTNLHVLPMGKILPETVQNIGDGWYSVKLLNGDEIVTIQYKPEGTSGKSEVFYGRYHDWYLSLPRGYQVGATDAVDRFFQSHLR